MNSDRSRPTASPVLDLHSSLDFRDKLALARQDLRDTLALAPLCCTLAWLDIKVRYRGSALGPFWLTLSTAVMVASMSVIYGLLFKFNLHEYLPFLTLSIVLWGFMTSVVSDACVSFTQFESMIRAIRMPFALHAGRMVLRNILVLAHNLVVIVVVDLLLWVGPGRVALLAIPAVLLWLAVAVALCLLMGAVCARYRDVALIVSNVMQMAFFVSAVIWRAQQLAEFEPLLLLNPFYVLLEIVRGPLLGELPSVWVYLMALVYSGAIFAAAGLVFARARGRIAFWV